MGDQWILPLHHIRSLMVKVKSHSVGMTLGNQDQDMECLEQDHPSLGGRGDSSLLYRADEAHPVPALTKLPTSDLRFSFQAKSFFPSFEAHTSRSFVSIALLSTLTQSQTHQKVPWQHIRVRPAGRQEGRSETETKEGMKW